MTRHLFSTKSFVPGHVAGAAMILFGTIAMAKWAVERHRSNVDATSTAMQNRGRYGAQP